MTEEERELEMARSEFREKESTLRERFERVAPLDFYRDLFPAGQFETEGMEGNTGLCNGFVRFQPEQPDYDEAKKAIPIKAAAAGMPAGIGRELVEAFGMVPVDNPQFELKVAKRLDRLDERFNAGKYGEPGQKIMSEEHWGRLVFDDLESLRHVQGYSWAISYPIGFYGGKGDSHHASLLYAIVLDIDGVTPQKLLNMLKQFRLGLRPEPTYLVNSGHGVHLYYLLDMPIELYKNRQADISKFKYSLAEVIWQDDVAKKGPPQLQPVIQPYRVVGSLTKLGEGYTCSAYRLSGKRVSLDSLNEFIAQWHPFGKRACLQFKVPKNSKEYCREHFPEWYNRVFLHKAPAKKAKGDQRHLLQTIKKWLLAYCRDGNRYNSLKWYFSDAAFLGVPFEEAEQWAISVLEILDGRTERRDNRFTRKDIDAAAGVYESGGHPPRLSVLEDLWGVRLPRNKRNKRSRQEHLDGVRAFMDAGLIPDTRFGGKNGNTPGRPAGAKDRGQRHRTADSAEGKVRAYLQEHPDAKTGDIISATGLSKKTVCKWLRVVRAEAGDPAQLPEGEQLSIEGD